MGTQDELTGIKQRVYLPVPRTYGYNVSLYAKHVSGPSRVKVSLRTRDSEKVLATAFVDATAGERNEGGAVMIASTFNTFFRHNSEVKLVD